MTRLGLLLVIAGGFVLVNKGISYTKTTQLIDAGPVQASVQTTKNVPVESWVGLSAVAVGLLLMLRGRGAQRL